MNKQSILKRIDKLNQEHKGKMTYETIIKALEEGKKPIDNNIYKLLEPCLDTNEY